MSVEERITAYINSLDRGNSEFLNQLRRQAVSQGIPIIRQEAEHLLKMLVRLKQPQQILEVGTAVGYSCLLYTSPSPRDCS